MNKQRIYPHVFNGRFYNYPKEVPEGFFFRSCYIYLKSYINRLFYHPHVASWETKQAPIKRSVSPVITWIGHSTFLIQTDGINILTDPIFGDATSFFPRILHPGIALKDLPPIDYVIISHNHLDHMDEASLNHVRDANLDCYFLVPIGDKAWFDKRSYTRVREYTWWQKDHFISPHDPAAEIDFTFLPAFHWSQRTLFDKNKSLWGSWMIQVNNKKIYFGGDTAYSRHFKHIGQEFDNIDYAIMPIGPCEPHKWMKLSHVNAREAYQGFKDLNARNFIPMHWGTFYLGTDTFDMPIKLLRQVWQEFERKGSVLQDQLHIMKAGQRLPLPTQPDVPTKQPHIEKTV